jgi:hypothetical protein
VAVSLLTAGADTDDAPAQLGVGDALIDVTGTLHRVVPVLLPVVLDADLPFRPAR